MLCNSDYEELIAWEKTGLGRTGRSVSLKHSISQKEKQNESEREWQAGVGFYEHPEVDHARDCRKINKTVQGRPSFPSEPLDHFVG